MRNVRVRVIENCIGHLWWFGIYEGRRRLLAGSNCYKRKGNAIRRAKAMAKRIGITYDPKIKKLHGC